MSFRWWTDGGPLRVVFRSSFPSSTKKQKKKKKRCQIWTPSDKTFLIRACNPIPQRDVLLSYYKHSTPRSGISCRSCLIRVNSVCIWKYKYNRFNSTQMDLISNVLVQCTNMNDFFYNYSECVETSMNIPEGNG